jgi:hypothetical protein
MALRNELVRVAVSGAGTCQASELTIPMRQRLKAGSLKSAYNRAPPSRSVSEDRGAHIARHFGGAKSGPTVHGEKRRYASCESLPAFLQAPFLPPSAIQDWIDTALGSRQKWVRP